MKKIFLAFMFVVFSQLHALDAVSAIPSDHRTLLDKVLVDLHLENADDASRNAIYGELKPFLKDGWYSHWISNRTGSDSKVENAPTIFTDIMLYNNQRVTNVTFIYFKNYNQVFVGVKEFLPTSDTLALKRFRKNKTDAKLEKLNETDNYAVFNEKGFMGYETAHIKGANAMMVYETSNYINVYTKAGKGLSTRGLDKIAPTTTTTPTQTPSVETKEEDLTLIPKS